MRVPPASRLLAAVVSTILLGGCMVGPNYRRPEVTVPQSHRGAEGTPTEESLADLPWWQVFDDEALHGLIHEAIAGNYDLRIAAARVAEARAQAGIARSFLFPEVGAFGGYAAERASLLTDPPPASSDRDHQNWQAGVQVSWEIDFFGRVRREKEAAFARFLATEEGQRSVLVTLVGDVASTYFLLRELDAELDIAKQTLAINDETVNFYEKRLQGGVSNRLEVDQAKANRELTASTIPEFERQIAVTENALSVLLGRLPGSIRRGNALDAQHLPPHVPAGLPASLLERRPDVMQAEQNLVAANADIGAAKALFFPSISLTGLFGGASHDLSDLVKGDSVIWSLGAGILQPIFQGGRIRRNYEAAQARFEAAVAEYQKAALNGYREVADSLATIDKLAQVRMSQERAVEALRDAASLARLRYDTGRSNYLEVLIADQSLFQQQLRLAQTRGAQMQALAQLYRALGGGWQPEPTAAPANAGN